MGTSISQPSPRNINWNRVFVCYENNNIPDNRVINEIWRASDNEVIPISDDLKSNVIYQCYLSVKSSKNFSEALQKYTNSIIELKNNSIIAEFAKRVIPQAFDSKDPVQQWTNGFFKEITNYIISRDASGFIGENYRSKSVKDLIKFKQTIGDRVSNIISSEKTDFKSHGDWNTFIDKSVSKLKSNK